MSKLESAFSKALKERAAAAKSAEPGPTFEHGTSKPVVDAHQMTVTPVASPDAASRPANQLRELVSARNQIRKMSHDSLLSDAQLAEKRLIYPRMKDVNLLNIYRNLRTKLLSAATSANFITLVTSVCPGGGSSLISANLAATFAFDEGKTALLIEGNVLSPSLAGLFDLEHESTGLMDYLESDDLAVNNILYETGIPRLRFVPGGKGRENASEYFTSEKMREMLREIVSRYPERYPIIDAPSITDSADARILLDLCDQVVLVVPYGLCSEDDIKGAAQTIGGKLMGVVLNQF